MQEENTQPSNNNPKLKLIALALGVALVLVVGLIAVPLFTSSNSMSEIVGKGTTDNPFSVSANGPVDVRLDPAIVSQVAAAMQAQSAKPEAVRKAKPAAPKPAEPKFETVTKRVCEPQTVMVEVDVPDPVKPAERSAAGMLLGAGIGALLGNQVGGGNGKTIATIAGGAAGAYAGDRMVNGNGGQTAQTIHKEQRQVVTEVCRDVSEKVRVN